jgi:hypothetical protein
MDDDHAVALIRSRCGDALTELELDQIDAAIRQQPPPVMLDADVAEKLTTVVDAMERRLDAMTEVLAERSLAQQQEDAFVDAAAEVLH